MYSSTMYSVLIQPKLSTMPTIHGSVICTYMYKYMINM